MAHTAEYELSESKKQPTRSKLFSILESIFLMKDRTRDLVDPPPSIRPDRPTAFLGHPSFTDQELEDLLSEPHVSIPLPAGASQRGPGETE